jgi:hypothetical protein
LRFVSLEDEVEEEKGGIQTREKYDRNERLDGKELVKRR